MDSRIFSTVLWFIVIEYVSSTWSSSINSLFSVKSVKISEMAINKDLLESMAIGAQMALEHCQSKFKWDRWNCPESSFARHNRQMISREIAFVSAITSAGIMHAVTRNCSRGELYGCGCDPNRVSQIPSNDINVNMENKQLPAKNDGGNFTNSSHWMWGGCSDYLDYGEQVAKNILGEMERGQDLQANVNLHNNAVGRLLIRTTMQKRCRCHGVSGSCSMQTCWMQMAPFSVVTNELRKRYERAQKIEHTPKFNLASTYDITHDTPIEDLMYLTDNPNYCKADVMQGWIGTKGRHCSRNKGDTVTPAERKSCKNLCRSCGYRVRRERRKITKRCNCTFHWCCEVKCDICMETLDEYFCE